MISHGPEKRQLTGLTEVLAPFTPCLLAEALVAGGLLRVPVAQQPAAFADHMPIPALPAVLIVSAVSCPRMLSESALNTRPDRCSHHDESMKRAIGRRPRNAGGSRPVSRVTDRDGPAPPVSPPECSSSQPAASAGRSPAQLPRSGRCAVCTLGPPDGQRHSIFPLRMPTDHRLRRMTNRYRLSPLSSSPPLMSSATRSALPVFRHHAGMSRQLPWSVLMSSNASPGATWWAALLASTTGPGQNRPEASTMRTGTSCSVEVLGAGTFSLTFPLPESAWLRSFRSTAWYRHRGPARSRTR